jgi:NADH-quinone oxidoreductase subunit L
LHRRVPNPEASRSLLYRFFINKFYVDEIYNALFVMPFCVATEILQWGIEALGIDLLLTGSGYLVAYLANLLRRIQTGVVNSYAFGILLGIVAVLVYLLKNW